jgi:hypothetical protein
LGRFWKDSRVSALGSLALAEQLGLSKSTGPLLSNFLEDSRSGFAGHLPIIFRSVVIVAFAELRVCESGH